MRFEKCNKCDDRGHIQDDKYSSHSCNCAWSKERTKRLGTESLKDLEKQNKMANKEKVMKALLINEELHTKLKIKTSKEKKSINEVVENLITKYLHEKSL